MTKRETVQVVQSENLGPKIVVIGVGGAGGNAVNNMIRSNLEGVDFVVANTDAQALKQSLADESQRIQLGLSITQGLGAGSKPDVGKASAEESSDDILKVIEGANMVFITAGMGGGTGTGAAPVIAKIAREAGILTVGVVTKPFLFEGSHRAKSAENGISELQQYVDTLLVIPNQNLFRLATEGTTFADAFKMADNVLYSGVRGVTDLMLMPGLINLDFADIRAVMSEMGKAMMGTGEAEGERRALDAAEVAISNPLLDDVSLQGAKGILINITGGYDMTLYEVDEAANRVREEVDPDANIIFGSTFDDRLNGKLRVSVVATGIGMPQDNLFKSRNVSDIMGFSKPDLNKMLDDTVLKINFPNQSEVNVEHEQNSVSEPVQENIKSQEYLKNEYDRNMEKDEQRKKPSFFNRFSRSRRRDDYEEKEITSQQIPSEKLVANNQDSSDEIDIPSCFRKKSS